MDFYAWIMEPISTLAVAGISWVATKTVDSITAGAADKAYVAAVRAIRERLPSLAVRPEGGDLARGLRQAQLRALEQVIRDYARERPLARLGGGSDAFTHRALEFCRSATDQPVLIPHIKGDALLPLASLHAEVDGVAAGAAAMEGAVLAELAVALGEVPIPSRFAEHLRNGGRGTPRFVELFGIYFAEQVKTDDAFREVLHTGLLLQNAANLAALGDWLTQAEARFGGALARVETGVADLAVENRAGFAAMQDSFAEVLEVLAAKKGVPAAALRSILEKLGESAVQDEEILARLSAKADEYLALREQLATLAKSTPNTSIVLSEGNQLLDAGDLDGARRLFADARATLRSTREQHARDEAALLAAEAGVDRLQLRYREAADRYQEAERLVASFDPDAGVDYLCRRAGTLEDYGGEFGDNGALEEAISLWRHATGMRPRLDAPLAWAMTQNNLGNALVTLGGRESEPARLEEAVSVYRAALEERTRERVPLDWAMTQNNLGSALQVLGEREAGTARLEEAVAAYRKALEERTRARRPLDWAMTQTNLGDALQTLGGRESGTARLAEAVSAYRSALEERTRERVPLEWAATQTNLATALWRFGERESGTAWLEAAVAAYRAALEEYTRERVPLDWASVQDNLGNALQTLGGRESGTARLEEAVAAYRAALEERTRERVPLAWAMTQNNLGNALFTLGGRESGTGRLGEAVAAYRAALEERTRERVPLAWAMTQSNLGNALSTLGERESGTTRLEEAVAAYRAALKERTQERVPLAWAMTQNNLGNALSTLGARESGTARLEEAVAAYLAALEERTRERVPLEWAATHNNLGNALATLGTRESGTARLEEAVAAFRAALGERTRERVPLDWAKTQSNLGNALQTLGAREIGTARLEEAVESFRSAAEVFAAAGADHHSEIVRQNLEMARHLLDVRLQEAG